MTSVLNVDTIADKAGTGPVALTKQQAAKAWVVWTTGDGHAVFDSFNVSTIVDDGTGLTTVNYTNSFGNVDYTITTGSAMYYAVVGGTTFAYETWPRPGSNLAGSTSYTGGFNNNTGSNITAHDMTTGNRCQSVNFGDLA